MDHVTPVGVVESFRHGPRDRHGLVNRELVLPIQFFPQRLAVYEGHHIVEIPIGFAGIVELHDVRVLEIGGYADLVQKSLGAQDRRELRPQHLDRDAPVMLEITGEVDLRHATLTQFTLDEVLVGKGGFEALKLVGHTFMKMWPIGQAR